MGFSLAEWTGFRDAAGDASAQPGDRARPKGADYKLGDLLGPNGPDVLGPVLAGSLAAFAAAYLSVRFLMRFFEDRTLTPFAIYCLAAGGGVAVWLALGR